MEWTVKIEKKRLEKTYLDRHCCIGLSLVLIQMVFGDKSPRLNVEKDKLTIGEVK